MSSRVRHTLDPSILNALGHCRPTIELPCGFRYQGNKITRANAWSDLRVYAPLISLGSTHKERESYTLSVPRDGWRKAHGHSLDDSGANSWCWDAEYWQLAGDQIFESPPAKYVFGDIPGLVTCTVNDHDIDVAGYRWTTWQDHDHVWHCGYKRVTLWSTRSDNYKSEYTELETQP